MKQNKKRVKSISDQITLIEEAQCTKMVRKLSTAAEFRECLVAAQKEDKLVAIDFTAAWCGPCQMIGPRFEAMAAEYQDVVFVKVDVDENKEVAAHCKISSMPTFQFWRDGKCVEAFSGADERRLRAMVQTLRFATVSIRSGIVVTIRGLKAQSAVQYNGRAGTIGTYDSAKTRYVVKLEGADGPSLALKPVNFTQRVEVVLSHITTRPDLNGEAAKIVDFDAESQCYRVELIDEEAGEWDGSIGPECVVLPDQTVAVIVGLKSAAQHNGKWAKVLSYDASSGRYLAQIDGSTQLKLKRQNLRVAA